MNKIIAAIVGLLVLATPAFAWSNVRSVLYASGETEINNLATIWGYDYSEPGWEMTAFIHEGVKNDGTLYFNNEITSPGEWEMVEEKIMSGTGDTKWKKEVAWWTEDSTIKYGEMKWPTEANIFVGFYTQTFTDEEEIHNVANLPIEGTGDQEGEFSHNYFLKVWDTDDNFNFEEGVGINLPEDCTPKVPHTWRFPRCEKPPC